MPDGEASSPLQAAAQIEADQFISRQFTLLDQANSKVVRGQVQLIPVGNAVLYIRPIWIEGGGGNNTSAFPRYNFVAAVVGDRAKLGYDVNDAVTALITGGSTRVERDVASGRSLSGANTGNTTPVTTPTTTPTTPGSQPPANASATQLLNDAQSAFDAANAALANRDLAGYQRYIAQAQADVRAAVGKLGTPATTPATAPPGTPTTKAPASTAPSTVSP